MIDTNRDAASTSRQGGRGTIQRRFVMRRITTLCATAGIAAAALTVTAPAKAGYYVIRWENTGICQIWNEELQYKPVEWPSHYKVVSKPVPNFTDAVNIQLQMREKRSCFL
jgi:hypothetical protein